MKNWIKQPENHAVLVFLIFWIILFSISLQEQLYLLHLDESIRFGLLLSLILVGFYFTIKLMSNTKVNWSLGLINLASLIVFIYEEELGTHYRNALLGSCLLVLFISSCLHKDWKQKGIWYAQQLVIATYFLSALSKLFASGFEWYCDAPNIVLQLLKSYEQEYIEVGQKEWLEIGAQKVLFFKTHPFFIKGLLLGSFYLELLTPILLWKRNWIPYYGFLLLSMHIGIFYFMEIIIPPIILPMIAFFINPTYLLMLVINRFRR